jgi:hypothetical protein
MGRRAPGPLRRRVNRLQQRLYFHVIEEGDTYTVVRLRSWIPVSLAPHFAAAMAERFRIKVWAAAEDPRLIKLGAPYRTRT